MGNKSHQTRIPDLPPRWRDPEPHRSPPALFTNRELEPCQVIAGDELHLGQAANHQPIAVFLRPVTKRISIRIWIGMMEKAGLSDASLMTQLARTVGQPEPNAAAPSYMDRHELLPDHLSQADDLELADFLNPDADAVERPTIVHPDQELDLFEGKVAETEVYINTRSVP